MLNLWPNDYIKIAASAKTSTVDAGTLGTTAVDMREYDVVMFLITAADADADTTIDAKLQEDTVSNFASPTDISDSSITQATAADAADEWIIQLKAESVSQRYVRCLVTAGNGTSGAEISIVALGVTKNYLPGANAATVVEVISV